jgi:hypothetical protein
MSMYGLRAETMDSVVTRRNLNGVDPPAVVAVHLGCRPCPVVMSRGR